MSPQLVVDPAAGLGAVHRQQLHIWEDRRQERMEDKDEDEDEKARSAASPETRTEERLICLCLIAHWCYLPSAKVFLAP